MRLYWFFAALILAACLASLQHWALGELIYWRYPWFDTLMHFLGGLTVGVFAIGLLQTKRALFFLFGMFLIAVGWEVFEYSIGTEREANFVFDTSLDLLMDAFGMLLAYGIARLTLWRSA